MTTTFDPTTLRRDGVSVVLAPRPDGLPGVLHWGADLGPLDGATVRTLADALSRQTPPGTLDAAWSLPLLPQDSDGWAGRPALTLARDHAPVHPRWSVTTVTTDDDGTVAVVEAHDDGAALRVTSRIEITAGGVVTVEHAVTHAGTDGTLDVVALEPTLPVPRQADHLTAFGGRWTREKAPVTSVLQPGPTVRESRRGRGGHDSPWVSILSAGAPRNRAGEAWAVHLGWSADLVHRVDRVSEHTTLLGAGELLRPGEVRLAPGETYRTPTAYFVWSAAGLDGLSDRFHTMLRARPQHPHVARPVVLNTWEAVYFDHSPEKIARLARRAAEVGVERFVLDDGWFPGRADDTAGLGDWVVDPVGWPDGLEPLASLVHDLGMEFGLWFEPEMINLDSELARTHPDWILANPASVPSPYGLSFRSQFVLDLAHPGAWEHVRSHMSELVERLGIDFIKWDHNRDLVEPVHDGRPGTHVQMLAAYRLIDRLKADHPGLEIESCSSGGARTDLGILARTDRVWASDSNDPVERQDIQRWTELVLPPELVGAHVGPSPAHSSGRTTDLSFRLATALTGSAGFEWNLLAASVDEVETITAFTALYRDLRHVLHTGHVVHADVVDPALRVRGVVAHDRSEAVWTVATVATLRDALTERLRFSGLDPDRQYTVRVREEIGKADWGWITPEWLSAGAITLPGSVLAEVGLQLPTLWPVQALVLHVTAA